MILRDAPPRYPKRGPSCLFVIFITFGVMVGLFVITNADEARELIIPTPTPEPTRSAAEFALLATLSEEDQEYDKAIEYYDQALRLDATKPEIFVRMVNLLVRTGQPERALETAEQATVLAPENDAVWTAYAAAFIANGRRLDTTGDSNGANLQYAEALQAANRAIDLNGANATAFAYAAAGLVLPGDPERYNQAQEMADTAVTLEPNNPIARYYLAIVFEYQGYYAAAIEQYTLGIESDPTFTDLYIGLAYNFYGTGSVSEAVLTFQEAISVNPESADAYDGLAYMYIQLGEAALAEEYALQAVELAPQMARAHGRLGEAYFRQNNYPKAIESLEQAVALYQEATELNARFFNMLATSYIRDDLSTCPLAEPIFNQVIQAVTVPESPVEAGALEGLEICRRAALENTP